MPWTVADVDKHKKGLSAKGKRQWVEVANSVLHKCMSDGGSEESCAASAIRQANGVTGNQLYINTRNQSYTIREATYNGKKHLVVPIIMMVEGVHNGSRGPLLHLAEELGKFPESWNGIPIVIQHPVDTNGINVSANSPEVLEISVGRTFNTHMDGAKLKTDGYIDPEKLQQVSPEAYNMVMTGEPLEVSIGVFTDEDETPGTWNNENYNAVARNHRPDHLALLPGAVGACSWNDGCGIRLNSENKKGGTMKVDEDKQQNVQRLLEANIDNGYKTIVQSTQRMLDRMDNQQASYYLEDMNNSHIIYSKRNRETPDQSYYQQEYEIDTNGTPVLMGNPTEVKQKVDYVPVRGHMVRNKVNNSKGGLNMNKGQECGKCMEKIVAIINSNANPFTEADREFLLAKEETWLDAVPVTTTPTVHSEPKITRDMVLNALSADDRDALEFGRAQKKARRDKWISGIQANTEKDTWTEADLNVMNDAFLEKLYNSVKSDEEETTEDEVINYALSGNSRRVENNSSVKHMYPTGIEMEKEK